MKAQPTMTAEEEAAWERNPMGGFRVPQHNTCADCGKPLGRESTIRCWECWLVYRATNRKVREPQSRPRPKADEHGTWSHYVHYRCRCQLCVMAASMYTRTRRAREAS